MLLWLMAQLPFDDGKIARREIIQIRKPRWRVAIEEFLKGLGCQYSTQGLELYFEIKPPQCRRIQPSGMVGCRQDWKIMPVEPGEQFVYLTNLPIGVG